MIRSSIPKKLKEYLEKGDELKSVVKDIHYWVNPETGEFNPSILIDGKKARLRAGIIIIKDKNQILLGQEEDDPEVFSLPGGAINKDETTVEAAVGEAKEEVNILVANAKETGFNYCVKHDDALPWVKENVPEEEWWYHYYTCLCIGEFDGYFDGKVDSIDKDIALLGTSKFYNIENVVDDLSFKTEWKKALIKFGYLEENKIEEEVEIHKELNPKIWDKNNELLEDVESKIYDIVDEFKKQLKKDNVKLDIADIYILGSNANYNYTDTSDLDVHIIANESFDCDEKHLPLIYNVYKSLFNLKYDISINGINVEIYVENVDDFQNVSTAIYSIKKGWIKEPSQENIPQIDEDKLEKMVAEWEDKYLKLIAIPTIKNIEDYINDLYDERRKSIKNDGEFGLGNLMFKEIRRLKYLENLKKLRTDLKNKELSLE